MAMKRVLTLLLAIMLLGLPLQHAHAQNSAKIHKVLVVPLDFTDIQIGTSAETLDSLATVLAAYYDAQFPDSLSFLIDVLPAFKINGASSTYGANTTYRRDALAYRMALTAYRTLYDTMDFSIYDNDGDGYVNDIIFLTPGIPETYGGGDKQFWPQYTELEDKDIPYSLKVRLKGFGLAPELNADGVPSGIGILAHELGHILGLKDLYDTDGDASGGSFPGLGKVSLMDVGLENDSGNTPPNLNAVERDLLGIGKCELLDTSGTFSLEPIHLQGRYFKLPAVESGKYYLLENRSATGNDAYIGGQGMLIYKVDRSEADAGYSTYFQRTLTALERWNLNQVNCNPDYPCAEIVPAKVDSLDSSAIFWPKEGRKIFSPGKIAITDISSSADGTISFKAVEPITIEGVSVFQTSAIISMSVSNELGAIDSLKLEWYFRDTVLGKGDGTVTGDGKYSFTLKGLSPRTKYGYTATVYYSDGSSYSASGSFTTRIYRSGIFRFIYLGDVSRNRDGSFRSGASIPLIVYNSVNEDIVWYFNGRQISPGPDGLWTIPGDGELRAEIFNEDGSKDVISKVINVK